MPKAKGRPINTFKTNITIDALKHALERSWTKETSANPEGWSPQNAAFGQCAVTALIVNDFFGGKLVRVGAKNESENVDVSHYYNELTDGSIIDLTRRQFPPETTFSEPIYKERAYAEGRSTPGATTFERYTNLKARVALELAKRP